MNTFSKDKVLIQRLYDRLLNLGNNILIRLLDKEWSVVRGNKIDVPTSSYLTNIIHLKINIVLI